MPRAQARMRRIAAECRTEGMAITHAVETERTDQQVQIDRIDVAAELPSRDTTREQVLNGVNHGDIAAFEGLDLLDVLRAVNVFNGDEPHEIALTVVVVERKLDERAHALDRIEFGNVQVLFECAYVSVHL